MLASQVALFLGKSQDVLFESFPGLSRRTATIAERALLANARITSAPYVTLVRTARNGCKGF